MSAASWLMRASSVCGVAIFVLVLIVSPKGLATAVAFLSPIFVPSMVGILLGFTLRSSRTRRSSVGRHLLIALLMIPGFLLATFLAVTYSPDSSDTPARGGRAAAHVVDVVAPLGAALALTGAVLAGAGRPVRQGLRDAG
jgi:hypothetical protein